jgi:hypothetical protein
MEQLRQEQGYSAQPTGMLPPPVVPRNAPSTPARAESPPISETASASLSGLTQPSIDVGEEASTRTTSYPDELFELNDYRPPQASDREADRKALFTLRRRGIKKPRDQPHPVIYRATDNDEYRKWLFSLEEFFEADHTCMDWFEYQPYQTRWALAHCSNRVKELYKVKFPKDTPRFKEMKNWAIGLINKHKNLQEAMSEQFDLATQKETESVREYAARLIQYQSQMKEEERTGDIQIYTRLRNSVLPSIKERREQFDVTRNLDLTEYIDHLTAVENNILGRRLTLSNRRKDGSKNANLLDRVERPRHHPSGRNNFDRGRGRGRGRPSSARGRDSGPRHQFSTDPAKKRKIAEGSCFSCGEPGHIARNCSNKKADLKASTVEVPKNGLPQ